ncbi:LytR family transcriptional regulator [Streptomyces sp. SID4950]|nr:LytR family transcriptional regulator [Streptomyces sp. SID4950]
MGGKYRISGDVYPRMRQRRRRGRLAVLVVASVAALGLVGWGTLQLVDVFTGGGKASAANSAAGCPSPKASASQAAARKGPLPVPGEITVNVLNATPRSGLAKETADELKKRGFKIGEVGNATKEYDKKVPGSGLLLGPKAALDSALPVLGTQLGDAERRTDAARKGTDVDLILGTGFTSLTAKAAADKALAELAAPEPTPAASSKKKTC